MITWMQRHKKYLIITIWISTIAFVGAGFVGWGQYSYGDKAGAVAKVGNIEISMGELQKTYSNLYNQYNQIFQGNFDEEKAKSFGLQSQALQNLTQQALILNLAASYDLEVSDEELLADIEKQEVFFKDGSFNKEVYKEVLSRNNFNIKEYEKDLRKELLVKKTLELLPIIENKNEAKIMDTILSIADKIDYKVLDDSTISIDTSDEFVKTFWEKSQQNYMSEVSYDIEFIKQAKANQDHDEAKLNEYYSENKTHFKGEDGKILAFADAKELVIAELNKKSTKDLALRAYIAYKKGKLSPEVKIESFKLSASNNPYGDEVLQKVSKLSVTSPFLKPVLVGDEYITIKLLAVNPSKAKTYEEAKAEVLPLYIAEQKRQKLLKLAKDSVSSFKGTTTDFIVNTDASKLDKLPTLEANDFLAKLFMEQNKRGFIELDNGKIVLYNILEQKMLQKAKENKTNDDTIVKIKSSMFDEGLIKTLQNKYKTEIFIQGL